MHEPFFLINDSSIWPSLLVQIFHNLGLKFSTLCISLNSTDYFDSIHLICILILFIHLDTFKSASESTIAKMANYFILISTYILTVLQNHVFLPNKMVCIFTPINLWVSSAKSVLGCWWFELTRTPNATFDSTFTTVHLMLLWTVLEKSRMQLIFWFITECGSVSPLHIVSLCDWSIDIVWFKALLRVELVLVLGSSTSIFILPWTLYTLESMRAIAWPKSLLPASVLTFCWGSTPFVVVRMRTRVRQWLMSWMGPWTGAFTPWDMVFHITSSRWKFGWWFVSSIWCRSNACIMFQSFLMPWPMCMNSLFRTNLTLLIIIAPFRTRIMALMTAFFIVKPLRISFIAVISAT